MAKNLDWFQAKQLAENGEKIRRSKWEKWIYIYNFVWIMWEGDEKHVVEAEEFGTNEFLATDWTNEDWHLADDPDPPSDGGGIIIVPGPGTGGGTPTPGTGGGGGGTDPGTGGTPDPVDNTPPSTGGGWGSPINPPDNNGTGGSTGGGSTGGGSTGGGGGGGGGGNAGSGETGNATPPVTTGSPTVTVRVIGNDSPDGPYCYLNAPGTLAVPATCTITAQVTVKGGPAGVGTIEVLGPSGIKLGTIANGGTNSFQWKDVPIIPGNTITITANYTNGVSTGTGTGKHEFYPMCTLVTVTWEGDATIVDKTTTHSPDGSYPYYTETLVSGKQYEGDYSRSAKYAFSTKKDRKDDGSLNDSTFPISAVWRMDIAATYPVDTLPNPAGGVVPGGPYDGYFQNRSLAPDMTPIDPADRSGIVVGVPGSVVFAGSVGAEVVQSPKELPIWGATRTEQYPNPPVTDGPQRTISYTTSYTVSPS